MAKTSSSPAPSLSLELRGDGVAVVTFDTPGSSVNVLSRELVGEVERALDAIAEEPKIVAAVLVSGKPGTFIAGADLDQVLAMNSAEEGSRLSATGHALLDRIAASGKPFVAAVHGAALGGGLEVALACKYILATDDEKTQLGLPEVMVGLLPGGGGTQRLPARVGLTAALPLLLTGKKLRAREAYKAGLVDALTTPGGLVETACLAARKLANGTLEPRERELSLDSLFSSTPLYRFVLSKAREDVMKKTRGLYPAPLAILDCVEAGLAGGFAAGQDKEVELFGKLVAGSEAKNLIRLFKAMTDLKKTAADEKALAQPVKRLAVLGAGLMGEGIASVSLNLSSVVVKDVADASLARAAKNISRSLARRVKSGSLSRVSRDRQWAGLSLTTDPARIAGATLVIEAVFEDLEVKRNVLAETEAVIADDAVFATNTSALPIGQIAKAAKDPTRVLGMHYFSPVPKMPLLEIVVTSKTSQKALATARAYGIAQGKTVIVVKDGPGFYTSRILAPFMNEAMLLLEEGAEIEALDRALKDFGFPVGPVTLLDEVGLDVAAHVGRDLGKAFVKRGLTPSAALPLIVDAGNLGRKNGKGFFLYAKDGHGKKPVNTDVYRFLGGSTRKAFPASEVVDRLTLQMANEAVYALEEGVLSSPQDGDVGAILGLGFPPFRGGPFRFLDALGAEKAVTRMHELALAHGSRFTPHKRLVKMAVAGTRFYRE